MVSRLVVAATVAVAAAAPEHQPAFFWSPQEIEGLQKGSSREHHIEATGYDIESTISALTGSGSAGGSPLFKGRPAKLPEVTVVFLASGLQTDAVRQHGARLPTVQALLDKSASSLSVPFTLPVGKPLFERAYARVTGAEAEAYFRQHAHLCSNGASEVVVVELDAAVAGDEALLSAHDSLIGKIALAVDAGTKGNYAAVLTAGTSGVHRLLASKADDAVPLLHTTPTLLTAQLVMLILIMIFFSGFCCLFSLQTPKKFDEVKNA